MKTFLRLNTWSGLLDHVIKVLVICASLCLIFLMGLIALSVVMRYVVGDPLLGVNEIVQLTAVAMIMASLPYCTARLGHVQVDVFDRSLGRVGRWLSDLLWRALSIFTLGAIVHKGYYKSLDALEFEDVTNMLSLPIWPFYAILAIGAAIAALVYIEQIIELLVYGQLRSIKDHDNEP